MDSALTVGRIRGIPIRLHFSWFAIALLVTYALAAVILPRQYPGWGVPGYWLTAVATALLFFGSVLVHELGHSILAQREGIPVRDITLFVFGGMAHIAREPATPGAEFRIAIAGPLTSLALAAGFGLAVPILSALDTPITAMVLYLAQVNLLLAAFNMIPGFPLDGGRVLRSLIWRWKGSQNKATLWASSVGRGIAFLFIGFGLFQTISGSLANGLWIGLIGWYLNTTAQSSYQHAVVREMLGGVTASGLEPEPCATVPADLQLDRLVQDHVLARGDYCFFVASAEDRPGVAGMVTLSQIREVPRGRWSQLRARQVMTPAHTVLWARPDEEVLALLDRMEEADLDHLPLESDGRPLGIITRSRLLSYIRVRSEWDA